MKSASYGRTALRHFLATWLLLGYTALLLGCEYVRPTMNAPLARWDAAYGYRATNFPPSDTGSSDSLFIVASFSGGGARASALAYGVLQELARTSIRWDGVDKRLLDELNIINALSGGSFTAAYYGLYGDRIFEDFEHRFLRKNWESELRSRIFRSPSNWLRMWSPYFGRAHIFSELLDEALFDGHTFGDLVTRHRRPMIFIHASDMLSLSRFEFNQFQFDLICSDLSKLPISVATASSAALPVILSPISMTNYAGRCEYQPSMLLLDHHHASLGRQRAHELRSYLDPTKRPYIHLLDGGLSDNIGMREVLENTAFVGDLESTFMSLGAKRIRKLVYLVVNAETSQDPSQYTLNKIPGFLRVSQALVDIPINRYSADTLELLEEAIQQWRLQLRQKTNVGHGVFAQDADIYYINASLTELTEPEEVARLMNIPTNLALSDEDVEHLLRAGSRLLRNSPEFQRLMRDLEREPVAPSGRSVQSQEP